MTTRHPHKQKDKKLTRNVKPIRKRSSPITLKTRNCKRPKALFVFIPEADKEAKKNTLSYVWQMERVVLRKILEKLSRIKSCEFSILCLQTIQNRVL